MGDTRLTHIDGEGRARMVDVSAKAETSRRAVAEGKVLMTPETLALALSGQGKKGAVITVSETAGIMGAKRTADLIPMCHPLPLTGVKVSIAALPGEAGLCVTAEVSTKGQTGVEMEALTAVSVACLTIYDMLKAADRSMEMTGIRLVEKSGGASGDYRRGDNGT
jgi:cyclic pyranopterin phosphate synthase